MGDDVATIALIAARGGSRGLPRKNVLPLAGRPLIAHTIGHARDSGVCDVVLVSTEDDEIAAIAAEYGAEVIERPPALAADTVPAEPVIQHALTAYEDQHDMRFEIAVYLQATDVFRTPALIRRCVETLAKDPELDSVFSGYATHKNFWRRGDNGFERVWKPDLVYVNRQKGEYLFREDTGVACATRAELVRQGSRIGPRVEIIPTDDFRTSIDIHSEFDLWLANQIMNGWENDDE